MRQGSGFSSADSQFCHFPLKPNVLNGMAQDVKEIAGYRVLAKLGQGAASDIYVVQDPKSKQVWALKHVIKDDEKSQRFIEQIEREYEVGSKLDHPHIRKVFRLIRHRKFFQVRAASLLMELVDAATFDQRLPKTDAEAVRFFSQVARGLAHMHSRGYVHADMKPNNVLVTEQGEAKIIDLGQACRVGTVKPRIQGTPGYMAPEQAHRQAITAQTDVYNFGAMMYWVLIREVIPTALPPKSENDSLYTGAIDAEMVEMPKPPEKKRPGTHPLLSKQIMDCIQVRPEDRPESMEMVANRLELIGDLFETADQDMSAVADDETQF